MIQLTRHVLAVCVLASVCSPAFAGEQGAASPSAADIATARELFREAARLAKEEKWAQALDAYQRSMKLRPSNLTRYGIAVVQERMGKLIEAMETLRQFIDADHDASTRRYVSTARDMVRDIENRIGRLKIVIPGNPRGAKVFVDGELVPDAAIGVHRPTDPGPHHIEARIPGHAPFKKDIELEERGEIEVVVQLAKAGNQDTAPTTAQGATTEPERAGDDSAGLIVTIGGGVVFAAGLGLGIYGYSKAKGAETSDGSDADSARTMALVGDIGMGVGLVTAGIGTYMLMSGPSEEKATSGVTFSPWAAKDGAGIGAVGRF